MQQAAERRDAQALNRHVDDPSVRASLKQQLSAQFARELGRQEVAGGDAGRAGMALGALLGMALVEKVIDALVQPEMVMQAMAEGRVRHPLADGPGAQGAGGPAAAADPGSPPRWTTERLDLDRIVARARPEGAASEPPVDLVFQRSGFADWKLVEVRLPLPR